MADTDSTLGFFSDCGDAAVGDLTLEAVRGKESLSTPYEYELLLLSTADQGLAIESVEAMLGQPCRFTFGAGQSVSGVLSQVTLEPTVDPARVSYRATLRPRLWKLASSVRSRVFQDVSVLTLLEAVLGEHSVLFQRNTLGTYPESEYVVQYQESDLDFLSRQMEHWGLFYFFEQNPDGETLVLADDNRAFTAHADFGSLTFATDLETVDGGGRVGPMGRELAPQPASLTLADYNWRVSYLDDEGLMTARQLQLRAERAVDEVTGAGAHSSYGEHFKDEAQGAWLAQVRAEEMLAERSVYRASFRAAGLSPGHRYQASGMPIAELEQEYVVRATETVLDRRAESATLAQKMTAFALETPYRAPRRTHKPKIHGFMHAVVDGETVSTAAPIDEHGRYRCVMPYDVAAAPGGRASRWIRMGQSSAGSGYGMHLPLHIGTEVGIVHLDGDPDRPVIIASIPNVDTMSPVVQDNATQSRIKTKSNILFELEDDAR